jgi:RND family efflux transporter MFP subunit
MSLLFRPRHLAAAFLSSGIALLWGAAVSAQEYPPAPVIVSEVIQRQVPQSISLVGTVQGRRSATIGSEVDGKIVRRLVEEGQTVKRGTALFRIENDPLESSRQEAEADVELRRFEHQRDQELYDQEAISEQQFRAGVYQLARAQSKEATLKRQLDDLTVRAPFAGSITRTLAEVGEWVNRGTNLARLVSTDTLRIYVDVPEAFVPRLNVGDEVEVVIEAMGAAPIQGRIAAVLAEGSAEARTFPVVIEAINPGKVRASMSARVTFSSPGEQDLLLVHKDAVVTSAFGQSVFIASEDKAVSRPLKTGLSYQEYIAVEGELQPGELIIVRGNERLRDGQAIRVIRKVQ